ncbi:hypothetical protein M422DRAFT_273725 [Sphaerobolus stellatus SS14]|uniref:C2H2-type domain-containing protein n=1 Tax=Sphaerobolus stellatus (strain SS14) TaxID=990650 RepID=A0A0C9U8D0_SPHS4|nr:hypothetical protein M422DRAFT_273725 [Sphaerobolus stellatus SS14]
MIVRTRFHHTLGETSLWPFIIELSKGLDTCGGICRLETRYTSPWAYHVRLSIRELTALPLTFFRIPSPRFSFTASMSYTYETSNPKTLFVDSEAYRDESIQYHCEFNANPRLSPNSSTHTLAYLPMKHGQYEQSQYLSDDVSAACILSRQVDLGNNLNPVPSQVNVKNVTVTQFAPHSSATNEGQTNTRNTSTGSPTASTEASQAGPTHNSYCRLSAENLPPYNYDIALNNIAPLSGDPDGAHQCLYICRRSVCRRSFKYALDAMLHVAEDHLANVRFKCSCGRVFTKEKPPIDDGNHHLLDENRRRVLQCYEAFKPLIDGSSETIPHGGTSLTLSTKDSKMMPTPP